tara:strand:- start:3 stop:293 length:291 start_codon:yes stop_codon:yes gene_type:complete
MTQSDTLMSLTKRLASDERLELLEMFKASVAIERLAPTAFDHGAAVIASSSRWPHKNKEDFTITIIDGNGAKLVTVVGEAIPDELFASYKNRIVKN